MTPETSITHFASAMQTPVIALLPDRGNIPIEWLPIGTPSRLLAPVVRGEAVETIPVGEVFDAAVDLLSGSWKLTQTSLDLSRPQDLSFQRANFEMSLSSVMGHNSA